MSVQHITIAAIAGAEIPHGGGVRLIDELAMPETDLAAIDGFTKRPRGARGEVTHQPGEQLHVLTDGEQLCVINQEPRWLRLSKGKIVK